MERSPGQSKVKSRGELLALRRRAREEGRTVVQCHGCFDIVHPGHVRHLRHAASQGDILLVSITADAVMNKGTGRPLFPQELRAENLVALDCVDWVHINGEETAEQLLADVRPDVYIKGREYETNEDPRFHAERSAVERHGGRVVFSSGDIVFSSTALVNALENTADPAHARFRTLVEMHGLTPERMEGLLGAFAGMRVCVVGETIVDTYVLCDRPDVAGESPVMSLRPLEYRSYDGGAAIIARHLAAMGAAPVLITALPETHEAELMRQRLGVEGVEVRSVVLDGPMLEKQRFLVGAQKVMKLDLVRPIAMDARRHDDLARLALDAASSCRAAIVSDFGHGMLTPAMLQRLCIGLRARVEVLTGDVSGRRSALMHMRSMDLVCPTEVELRDAMHDYDDSLNAVVWRFMQQTGTRQAAVTIGSEGLIAFGRLPDADQRSGWDARVRGEHVPSTAPYAIDPLGCGDALLAGATLSLAAGGTLMDGAFIGSIAAGAEAGRVGNEVITARDLRRGVERLCGSRLTISTVRPGMRLVV